MAHHVEMFRAIEVNQIGLYIQSIIDYAADNKIVNFHTHHITDHYVSLIVVYDGVKYKTDGPNSAPVIRGVEDTTLVFGSTWNPMEGITASDNEEGNITNLITIEGSVDTGVPGEYTLIYRIKDSRGLQDTKIRKVTVRDNEAPRLYGVEAITIPYDSVWDPMAGVTALDTEEGNLTEKVRVTGTVDTSKAGVYTVDYSVTDGRGLRSSFSRPVTVAPFDASKYYVVTIAGQSNAYGFDESPATAFDVNSDPNRLKYLGYHGNDNMKVLPVEVHTPGVQDTRLMCSQNKTSALPIGNALLPMIPPGYKLLILPIVWGGGNFTGSNADGTFDPVRLQPTNTTTQYSLRASSSFTTTMIERIKKVLDWNADNKFFAHFWCQGESDSGASVGAWSDAFLARANRIEEELTLGGYAPRSVTGNFGKELYYIWESCPYYMSLQHMKDKYEWYRSWNPGHVTNIPETVSSVDSNEPEYPVHHHDLSSVPNRHWGNGAYRRIIAPAVITIMDNANAFKGMLPVPEKSKERIVGSAWNKVSQAEFDYGTPIDLPVGAYYSIGPVGFSPSSGGTLHWFNESIDVLQTEPTPPGAGFRIKAIAAGTGLVRCVPSTGEIGAFEFRFRIFA